jgi:hypothetical protein
MFAPQCHVAVIVILRSWGPPAAYSNLWVNDYLSMFTDPVAALDVPGQYPLALTRGVWAGGQKHGVVLWSSDIRSTFEQLASMVPQGVHTSMSGIPYWSACQLARGGGWLVVGGRSRRWWFLLYCVLADAVTCRRIDALAA